MMTSDLIDGDPTTLLALNFFAFALATSAVWIAGTRLVVYGDEIAERFRLARAFVGLILLATITSLPEVVTTLTAASAGNASLALGNLFGGITMQTAILAGVDLFIVHHALTSWPRKPTHALEASFLIMFLTVLLGLSMFGEQELLWGIGVGGTALCLGYPATIAILRRYDERTSWAPIDLPDAAHKEIILMAKQPLKNMKSSTLMMRVVISALIILVAGYFTADRADAIAELSGLGGSFIGIALLAAATSTPELSTTIAAARMGAYTLAISNIFGSNLIMVALILPADIAYREGAILSEVTQADQLSILGGILVTAIYVTGLLIRRTPKLFGAGVDSIAVLAVYAASLYAVFLITQSAA